MIIFRPHYLHYQEIYFNAPSQVINETATYSYTLSETLLTSIMEIELAKEREH